MCIFLQSEHIFFTQKLRRYHTMQTESRLAEVKLKSAEGAQQKLQAPRKKASAKRAKNADKQREKVGSYVQHVVEVPTGRTTHLNSC